MDRDRPGKESDMLVAILARLRRAVFQNVTR
jgi:hypothetical protein